MPHESRFCSSADEQNCADVTTNSFDRTQEEWVSLREASLILVFTTTIGYEMQLGPPSSTQEYPEARGLIIGALMLQFCMI